MHDLDSNTLVHSEQLQEEEEEEEGEGEEGGGERERERESERDAPLFNTMGLIYG